MAANPPRHVTRAREERAWELRQQFWTEQRIADELGVAVSTVCEMLQRVERNIAERLAEHALPIKARQTAQLELVAAEAYAAWERSKLDGELERIITEEVSLVSEEDEDKVSVPGVKVKTTNERKGRDGDPAHLAAAMKAMADVRAIWGLDAPHKQEWSGPGGAPIEQNLRVTEIVVELDSRGTDGS